MTAFQDHSKDAVDAVRTEETSAQRQWVKPGLTRMSAGVAEFGGSISGDGASGLS
jgi:hypothetical protein